MNIYGTADFVNIQPKFKDLRLGDVFCFMDDMTKDKAELKVYMRAGHTSTDKTAINIGTGIMYTFDEDLLVKRLDASLYIKSI